MTPRRPPVRSGRLASDLFQTAFAAGGTFEWDPGVRLVYNQRFSRSRKGQRHSYAVPLIPDIALRVPDGPNAGLHLFDAKFRVHAVTDVGLAADDKDANDEKAAERAGSFKRAEIWRMHAYRDAIPDTRSVWILYPGGQFRFFGVSGSGGRSGRRAGSSSEGLPEEFDGVGAIPLAPVVGGKGAMTTTAGSREMLRERGGQGASSMLLGSSRSASRTTSNCAPASLLKLRSTLPV